MTKLDELERLAELHRSGALSEDEFALAKRRLLERPYVLRLALVGVALAALAAGAVGLAMFVGDPDAPATRSTATASAAGRVETSETAGRRRLAAVLRTDMLGAEIPNLESLTGPARNVDGPIRTYVVDGCDVRVRVSDNKVQALGLPQLWPSCGRWLAEFGFEGLTPDKATFGMFQDIQSSTHYTSDCLLYCGNAADPEVHATVRTTHATGSIMYRVSTSTAFEDAGRAADKWVEAMKADHGEDWVVKTRFNCTESEDPLATRLFKDVRITSLEIGRFVQTEACS